ncbi:tryptophan synthase subunit alpha [Oceanobacillus sp. E9]|uniref:tryptophan synthase subunit alpha n=1 Tax=Oceanobacillus TaxID=182709 RepID=UPI00084E4518|nr:MULTISPECIES: tryptophan synthase subunit alpha [Oceanobacillus]OEH53632.1 tryptophan synthase subunit alpha [Oceanobacillus sp. E9]
MGKSKLDGVLKAKKQANKPIFVPYIMAGDGGMNNLNNRIQFLEEAGASAIELGLPFSDPVADGPVIQDAGQRALANKTTISSVLEELEKYKLQRNIPIVLMTYINPVWKYGFDQFARDCSKAGVDGIIIPDIPMEEEDDVAFSLTQHEIAFIRLAAMTSTEDRLERIAKRSEGFLYAVSVTGTTGERAQHEKDAYHFLKRLKQVSYVPVLAGFGISTAERARELSAACDGVVVGSKIVQLFEQGDEEAISSLIQESIEVEVIK